MTSEERKRQTRNFGFCDTKGCNEPRNKCMHTCQKCIELEEEARDRLIGGEVKELYKARKTIVERVVDWNIARFDREFNYPLEHSMLTEEMDELYRAKTAVDKLDAVGDILFVAIGTLWKLGFEVGAIESIFYKEDADLTTMDLPHLVGFGNECKVFALDNLSGSGEPASWTGFSLAIDASFMVAIGSLRGLGYQEYLYDIVEAICDSNDTKVVKKTASDTKANIDKGQTFVPPTNRLKFIVDKACLAKYKK